MTFIAGHYAATWNGVNIGTTRDGFILRVSNHHEPVIIDDFGDAPADGIQRGTEYQLTLDFVEYNLMAPVIYGHNAFGEMLNVGKSLVGLAKTLVLTAQTGTPADLIAASIKTLTAVKAIVVSDIDVIMASRLRQGPLTFQLFPNTGDANKAFTYTHGVA